MTLKMTHIQCPHMATSKLMIFERMCPAHNRMEHLPTIAWTGLRADELSYALIAKECFLEYVNPRFATADHASSGFHTGAVLNFVLDLHACMACGGPLYVRFFDEVRTALPRDFTTYL